MNKFQYKIGLVSLSLLFTVCNVQGQEALERDSFVIVKEFVPTLSQASKIRVNPIISDSHHLDLNLTYEFLDKKIETSFKPEPIKAASLKGEPLVKLYRSYLIMGYGNNNTPLGELYFNQLRSKKTSFSLFAKHHSSNGIHNIENSDFSNNRLGFDGNYYTRNFTYNAKLNYRYDQYNYYGFSDLYPGLDVPVAQENADVMQFYNRFDASIGLGNNQRDTVGLRHKTDMTFKHIADRYGASENSFIIGQDLSLLNNNEVYTFDWSLDYNKYAIDKELIGVDSNNENSILNITPGIQLKGAKWRLDAALNVAGDFSKKTKLYVYPRVDFKYHLVKSIIIPYAGVSGKYRRNTYASFAQENPFLSPSVKLKNTDEVMTLYAGIGGNLSKNTSFDVSFTQSNYENMALFVKDTLSREWRSFAVAYDDVNMSTITAEVIYEPMKRWNLVVRGDYFIYNMKNELEAWHKPSYKLSVLAGYNLGDKVLVKLMVYGIGAQKAKTFDSEGSETLDGTADVNLDFEYRYTKKLSLFLDANNIASIKYQKWQDYPTQQFNVLAGFKFSF